MATQKIFTNLDLRGNELLRARLGALADTTNPPGTIGWSPNGYPVYIDNAGDERQLGGAIDLESIDQAALDHLLDRANHTGTQLAATISDFEAAAQTAGRTLAISELLAAAADVSMGGFKLTNVAAPAADTDAANKKYVDDATAVVAGDLATLVTDGAGKLATAQDFSLAGPVTATAVAFDGTGDVVLQTSIADGALTIAMVDGLADALGAVEDGAVLRSEIGQPGGVAPLHIETGKIAAEFLPSYVDDVVEYPDFATLPEAGESGKIYVTLDNGNIYRWGGSTYVRINNAVSLSEEATALETARNFSAEGVVTATAVAFDGTGDVVLQTSIADGALSIAKTDGLQTALDAKLDKTGGVVTGQIQQALAPVADADLANKKYVDDAVAAATPALGAGIVSTEDGLSLNTDESLGLHPLSGKLGVNYAHHLSTLSGSYTIVADVDGVVEHNQSFTSMFENYNADMRNATIRVMDADGEPVEFLVRPTNAAIQIAGTGAGDSEEFTVYWSL